MIRLSREIRFAWSTPNAAKVSNSWAGWPSTTSVAPHLVLRCVVAGELDVRSGYVCNIKDLDLLLRNVVTQIIAEAQSRPESAADLLRCIYFRCLQQWPGVPTIVGQTLFLSPFLRFAIGPENDHMIELTQQFEFSASHRLHCPEMSEQENRAKFGKCNLPHGHGHNYIVDVSWQLEQKTGEAVGIDLSRFESIVQRQVIDRLDHKHLNLDVEPFQRINPSVENITITIWNWLQGQFPEARLSRVRVYETAKTWAEIRGERIQGESCTEGL